MVHSSIKDMNLSNIFNLMRKNFLSFFLIIILVSSVNSFTFFTALKNNVNDIFVASNEGIYIYNRNLGLPWKLDTFSLSNSDSINMKQLIIDDSKFFIICQAGKYLALYEYFTDSKYEYEIFNSMTLNNNIASLIAYKYDTSFAYYGFHFIINYFDGNGCIISEERVFSKNIGFGKNKVVNSYSSENLKCIEKMISCHIMYSRNNDEILTCFCQKKSTNSLIAYSILVSDFNFLNLSELNRITETYTALNSITSSNKKIALVCHLNNKGEGKCHKYNEENNTWSNETIFFFDCKVDEKNSYQNSIEITYIEEKSEYILSCASGQSTNFVILDSNFEIKNKTQQNCYNNYNRSDLSTIFSNYLLYNNSDNKYYGITSGEKGSENVFDLKEITLDCSNFFEILKEEEEEEEIFEEKIENIEYEEIIEELEKEKNYEYENIDESNNDYNKNIKFDYSQQHEVIKGTIDKSKEEAINDINEVIDIIEVGKKYEIKGEDYEIKIRPVNSSVNDNSTHIDFGECEKILREKYKIPDEEILTVLQIEIESKNENSLVNQVEYAIYDSQKVKLDLSYCKNAQIKVSYEIKNSSLLNTTLISSFSEAGIDIFNIKDNFFNDICYAYSNGNTDITLEDRVNDIYQNYTLCEDNCDYEKVDISKNNIVCNCKVNTNITVEETTFTSDVVGMIKNSLQSSTIYIIKCYTLVFNSEAVSGNIGFWMFMIMIFAHIPLFGYFFIFEKNNTKSFIYKEMRINNFLSNLSNPVIKQKLTIIKEEVNNEYSSKNDKKNNEQLQKGNKKKKFSIFSNINMENDCLDEANENKKNLVNSRNRRYSINVSKAQSDNLSRVPFIQAKKRKNSSNQDYEIQKYGKENSASISFVNCNFNMKEKENKNKSSQLDKINSNNSIKFSNKKFIDPSKKNKKRKKIFKEPNFPGYYYLIFINNKDKKRPPQSKFILTNYNYKEAIKYDTRGFFHILLISLYFKQNILHTFLFKSDLESKSLRICLFIFSYASCCAFNALFYFNNNISERYHYEGDNLYLFSLVNDIVISICSTIGGFLLRLSMKYLTNSKKSIEIVFKRLEKKMRSNKAKQISESQKKSLSSKIEKILKRLKLKITIFIILEIFFMVFFTYYITVFCIVYKGTQSSWLLDSLVSFILTNLFDVFLAFIIAVFYSTALKSNLEILYNIALFIYDLGH